MIKRDIAGAIGVTVTPFTHGEQPDFYEIERQTETLCESDIDGIFPCSSTGNILKYPSKIKKK